MSLTLSSKSKKPSLVLTVLDPRVGCLTDDNPKYYWHCPHSMRGGVYASVGRLSVRLSVHLSVCPVRLAHAADAGWLPRTQRPGNIDRLLRGGQQQPRRGSKSCVYSATFSASVWSWTQTSSVFSRWQLKSSPQTCPLCNTVTQDISSVFIQD